MKDETVMGVTKLFENPVFNAACQEIESLGFRITTEPLPGSTPYGIIGGRSNSRWWLVPLANSSVVISGLALFQPIVTSARLLKSIAVAASRLGLTSLWARQKLYISAPPSLADIFATPNHSYAFFTGTDSPHRKISIQIMDNKGAIKGFAKVTCNKAVKPLLLHEAETLKYLKTLGLKTTLIPNVLYYGAFGDVDILLTDTLKTAETKTSTTLDDRHIALIRELAVKTPLSDPNRFVLELRQHYEAVAGRIPVEWWSRLEKAIEFLAGHTGDLGPMVLAHGDFTPWNTFFVDGKLYVFDWEYANHSCPLGYDLIHFELSLPEKKRQLASVTVNQVRNYLCEAKIVTDKNSADLHLLAYLCRHSLRYIAREVDTKDSVSTWDGEPAAAAFIDVILAS